jgi:hypothetical protein
MRCLLTIKDVPYGSFEWCCNVVLAHVGPLVSSHANYWPAVGLKLWHFTSKSEPILKIDGIGNDETK